MPAKTPEQIAEERIQQAHETRATKLYLFALGLTSLPESVGQLTQLQKIYLNNNDLCLLPEVLGQLVLLKEIRVHSNQLTALPKALGQLSQLQNLYLAGNQLRELPESIGQLEQLRILALAGNQLRELPESIGQLEQLRILDLAGNRLRELPASLGQLKALKVLSLHGNPALDLPPEILGQNRGAIRRLTSNSPRPADILEYYFRSRQSRPLNEAKLILVGRGGVGKTSLVKRLLFGTFDPHEKKTDGICITPWELALRDEKVRLNIWDFGGQEIMHATHQFFLTQRSLYLLVVNAREGAQDANVEYWLRLIESFGAESPVLVVINKVKDHNFDLNRRGLQEKFPSIRGFVQTDCEDATGLAELRRAIERETDRLEHLRDPFPASWFSIKDCLGSMPENFITYERYQEECRRFGVEESQSQDTLVGFLHNLGIMLNFKDDARLADTHVLNPQWVTNGVYQILNAERLAKSGGVLDMTDLQVILNPQDYPRAKHPFLIDLMQKFELCFRFEGAGERYLIPELLGKEEPELGDFESEDGLGFQYHYNILPEGLMPRFIVRTHEMSAHQPRWRTGVVLVLVYEGNSALVKADVQDRKVFITVTGNPEGRRRLLAIIRSHFDHIHDSIARLEATEMVPLTLDTEQVMSYRDLLVYEENGIAKHKMVVDGKLIEVDVVAVLNGIEAKQKRQSRRKEETNMEAKTLVCSYSHKDEGLRDELETHLSLLKRQGYLSMWHDRKIMPGQEWADAIDENFKTSDIILLLVSADFIASDYCYETEMKDAMRRHEAGEARVVPVILRDCDWSSAPFGKLQGLPKDAKPVNKWRPRDTAWKDVAIGIRRVVEEMRHNP